MDSLWLCNFHENCFLQLNFRKFLLFLKKIYYFITSQNIKKNIKTLTIAIPWLQQFYFLQVTEVWVPLAYDKNDTKSLHSFPKLNGTIFIKNIVKSFLTFFILSYSYVPLSSKWQPTPVLLPGKFHGQRSLVQAIVHGVTKSRTWLSDFTHRLQIKKKKKILFNSIKMDYSLLLKVHWTVKKLNGAKHRNWIRRWVVEVPVWKHW